MALKRHIVHPGHLPAATLLAAALILPFPALAQIDPNDGNSYATPPQMAPPAANTRDGASIGTVETVKPVAGGNGVNPCDTLAADPLDHDRVKTVPAVEFDALDGPAALSACEAASAAKPNILRLIYQTARAKEKQRDYAGALDLYRKAAGRGYPAAFAAIGYIYDNGQGVTQDENEALRWYLDAAQRNNAWGMFNLGYFYDNGRAVPEDDAVALDWYIKGAIGGNARAMNDAGFLLETSNTIPPRP
jgi:TPR repeat protein